MRLKSISVAVVSTLSAAGLLSGCGINSALPASTAVDGPENAGALAGVAMGWPAADRWSDDNRVCGENGRLRRQRYCSVLEQQFHLARCDHHDHQERYHRRRHVLLPGFDALHHRNPALSVFQRWNAGRRFRKFRRRSPRCSGAMHGWPARAQHRQQQPRRHQ